MSTRWTLSSGATRAMTPMSSISRFGLVVGHRRELGAGDRPARDAELAGDRLGGDRVVAGDHPDLDAGRVGLRDRVARLGPRRVDDADQRQQLEVRDQRQEVGVRVERGRVEVALGGRHDAQALRAEPLVLGQVRLAYVVDRIDLAVRALSPRGAGQQLVRRALDVAADDVLAERPSSGGTWP